MNSIVNKAAKVFLEDTDLDLDFLLNALKSVPGHLYADCYFQLYIANSWFLEDGIIKSGGFYIDKGVGIRLNFHEKSLLLYTGNINKHAISSSLKSLMSMDSSKEAIELKHEDIASPVYDLYKHTSTLDSISTDSKIALMKHAEQAARDADLRVSKITVSLSSSYETILIANSFGELSADIRPMSKFSVGVIAKDGDKTESAYSGHGGRISLLDITEDSVVEHAKEAVRICDVNLKAMKAPAGELPVVLGSGISGILLHEAVGHCLEGDFNRKGQSAFSGLLGSIVASKDVTVLDNGSIPNMRGSLHVDDEGVPGQENVLIENGVLKKYICDRLSARLMGVLPTGNGRRESYKCLPIPRMTNTYMKAGKHDKNDLIASIDRGVYVVGLNSGQVDITNGRFVFSANESYFIEHGKIQYPIKNATFTGNGPDVIKSISAIANDFEFDKGLNTCGKEGQSAPVNVGQPTIKVDRLIVGGTSN